MTRVIITVPRMRPLLLQGCIVLGRLWCALSKGHRRITQRDRTQVWEECYLCGKRFGKGWHL